MRVISDLLLYYAYYKITLWGTAENSNRLAGINKCLVLLSKLVSLKLFSVRKFTAVQSSENVVVKTETLPVPG